MKGTKGLIHCGTSYQEKYFQAIAPYFNCETFSKYNNSQNPLNGKGGIKRQAIELCLEKEPDFIMSGSPSSSHFQYSVPSAASSVSSTKSTVYCHHSYLLDLHKRKIVLPRDNSQCSVLPEYFRTRLGIEDQERVFFYEGHFKTVFHHENPPENKEIIEGVLFLPDVNTSIESIKRQTKNLENVYIRPHPGEYEGDSIGRAGGKSAGTIEKYKDFFGEEKVIENEELLQTIDRFNYLCSNYNSSVMMEFLIRGRIYGENKLVCSTQCANNSIKRLGIQTSSSPDLKSFGSAHEDVMSQCCLGSEEIMSNMKRATENALNSIDLSEEEIGNIIIKYYEGNMK